MFRITRRRPVEAGIQFCESCAEVTTAADRARDRLDRTRTRAYAALAGMR